MPEPIITTLYRIQTDPQGDNPVATAFFDQTVVVDGQSFDKGLTPVSWSILSTGQSVTVGGETLSYAQVSAFVTAIAYQEWANRPTGAA
jgi:hypothetical protein